MGRVELDVHGMSGRLWQEEALPLALVEQAVSSADESFRANRDIE